MTTSPARPTRTVLLATAAHLPDGEEWTGTHHLLPALAEVGVEGRWVVWDDPDVDWSRELVAVRSTWDYESRREEFLAWARSLPRMLNSAAVFAWNTDKATSRSSPRRACPSCRPCVVEGEDELPAAVAEHVPAVVKPTVGAGGRGWSSSTAPTAAPRALDESGLTPPPWVVQPLVESVRTEGETSVFVIDGAASRRPGRSRRRGDPRARAVRRHDGRGAARPTRRPTLARRTVAAAEALLGERLDYARVDQMRLADGTLAVSELEVTEPGLYLEILPGNAAAFAALVADRLACAADTCVRTPVTRGCPAVRRRRVDCGAR